MRSRLDKSLDAYDKSRRAGRPMVSVEAGGSVRFYAQRRSVTLSEVQEFIDVASRYESSDSDGQSLCSVSAGDNVNLVYYIKANPVSRVD